MESSMGKYLDKVQNDKIQIRLVKNKEELIAAQKLRYKIFFEECGATSSNPQVEIEKRDFDEFDDFCDHLIAIDKNAGDNPEDYIIGTYRLMRKDGAKKCGKWYSQTEFEVEKFNDYEGEVLELGRSCVAQNHRTKLVMQMLWNGLAAYMFDYDIKLMFGCGSFHGTDLNEYKQALSYLHYNFITSGKLDISAKGENKRAMDLLPKEEVDDKKALLEIPTMIKGYLRAGAKIGNSVWIDWDFNCFDVCIIFEMKDLRAKYLKHYENEIKK